MRGRLIFIVVMAVFAGAFAGLNWSEFTRSTPMSFGIAITDASLGLVMLFMLGLTLIVFLFSSAILETRHQIDYGRNQRTLEAQRSLADKAEGSRFNELRQQLDAHVRDNRQRETIAATEFSKALAQNQKDMHTQLSAMTQAMASNLREFESRIESRLDRLHGTTVVSDAGSVPPRTHVKL